MDTASRSESRTEGPATRPAGDRGEGASAPRYETAALDPLAEGGRRILPPAWFALALAAACALHFAWPGLQWLQGPTRWLGLLPAALGTYLVLRGSGHFRKLDNPIRPFTQSRLLVEDGPFRYTRNPMYLGLVLATVGAVAMLGSLTPWVVPSALAFGLDRGFVRPEERLLAARFGEDYARYCARVRRWL